MEESQRHPGILILFLHWCDIRFPHPPMHGLLFVQHYLYWLTILVGHGDFQVTLPRRKSSLGACEETVRVRQPAITLPAVDRARGSLNLVICTGNSRLRPAFSDAVLPPHTSPYRHPSPVGFPVPGSRPRPYPMPADSSSSLQLTRTSSILIFLGLTCSTQPPLTVQQAAFLRAAFNKRHALFQLYWYSIPLLFVTRMVSTLP